MKPLSLRELRRWLDRAEARAIRAGKQELEYRAVYSESGMMDERLWFRRPLRLAATYRSRIDRLQSILGADAVPDSALLCGLFLNEEEEFVQRVERLRETAERPKGTDEVRPQSDAPSEESPYHGGDGNSGECDHAAASSSEQSRMAQESIADSKSHSGSADEPANSPKPSDSASGESAGTPPTDRDDSLADRAVQADGPPTGEGEEDHPGATAPALSGSPAATDTPLPEAGDETTGCRAESAAIGDGGEDAEGVSCQDALGDATAADAAISDQIEEVSSLDVSASAPPSPRKGGGGFFADMKSHLSTKTAEYRKDVRAIISAINRLVRHFCAGNEERIPRYDGRKLAQETTSRRFQLSRALAQKGQKRITILMADCSGSCSSVCRETLDAAQMVAHLSGGKALAWATSNDVVYVDSRVTAGKRFHGGSSVALVQRYDQVPSIVQYIDETVHDPIGLVIVFGDTHGAGEYRQLCERGIPLIWLDNYCCGRMPASPAGRALREVARDWKQQPLAWFQAVGSGREAAIVLRQALKSARGHKGEKGGER